MKALKGNKVYTIDEKQKKNYVDAGFDIQDDNGKVIAYGRGKTVPYMDHVLLKEENEKLKEENRVLRVRIAELEATQMALQNGTATVTASGETAEAIQKKAGRKA